MNTIYHIFRADTYNHAVDLIRNIAESSKFDHYFVVVGVDQSNQQYFDELFVKTGIKNYLYIENNQNWNKRNLLKRLTGIEILYSEIKLLKYLKKDKSRILIFHSNFTTLFLLILKVLITNKRFWVCWGSYYKPMGARSFFRKIKQLLYKSLYNSFSGIVCLMEPDREYFEKKYKIKNTFFIPYYSELPHAVKELKENKAENTDKLKILLGNSGRCINAYYKDIDALLKFKNENIVIDCMLNYGSSKNQNMDLTSKAKSYYNDKFVAHTNMLQKTEYYGFMNSADIYISSVEGQSGLGAIYLLLLLGKKIYLNGYNLSYLSGLNFIVFDSNKITNINFETFKQSLSDNEKKLNFEKTMELLSVDTIVQKWENFYNYSLTC